MNEAIESVASVVPSQQKHVIPYLGDAPIELRLAALKAMANVAGLRLPDTRVPEGTALLPVGDENKRKLQCELAALPDLFPALDAYEARLKSEETKDSEVTLSALRMSPVTGGLFDPAVSNGSSPIAYTKDGFHHVAGFMKPAGIRYGFAENQLALPNALRAEVFNHWAAQAPSREVVARTFRGGSKGRIIRAVTSDSHSLLTGDDLAIVSVLRTLQPGAKARFTREAGGSYSELEVIWPMMQRELVVGDVAYGGIRITNSETRAGALRVEAFLLRVLCYNFTTAFTKDLDAKELTLRHVGDLTLKLPALIKEASSRIEPFVRMFGDAYRDRFPDFAPTRGELLERAGKVLELPESTMVAAQRLWDVDPAGKSAGDTRAGFVNALTRASQELEVSQATEVERAAGKVIARGWAALAD